MIVTLIQVPLSQYLNLGWTSITNPQELRKKEQIPD
jgi:hypothetical protein